MGRESHAELSIPTSVESAVYLDAQQITRDLGRHGTETFIGQVTGAAGAGGTLAGVPFDPAIVETINEAGAAPSNSKYVMLTSGAIGIQTILGVLDATSEAPTVTRQAGPPVTFDVLIDVADAPDAEVVTVICYGVREGNGSL